MEADNPGNDRRRSRLQLWMCRQFGRSEGGLLVHPWGMLLSFIYCNYSFIYTYIHIFLIIQVPLILSARMRLKAYVCKEYELGGLHDKFCIAGMGYDSSSGNSSNSKDAPYPSYGIVWWSEDYRISVRRLQREDPASSFCPTMHARGQPLSLSHTLLYIS